MFRRNFALIKENPLDQSKILLAVSVFCLTGIHSNAQSSRAAATANRWLSTPGRMATARSGACMVALPDGGVVIAGGEISGAALSAVDLFRSDGLFEAAAPMPEARTG